MTDAVLPPPAATPAAVAPPPGATPPPARTAPARPRFGGLDPATFRQTAIVAAILASAFFGSQVLNEALPAAQSDVVAGEPIAIGGSAEITPLTGWEATPHEGGSGIRLEKGVVVLDLFPETFGQNAGQLADAYLEEVLRPAATQLTASEPEVASGANGTAARFTYQGIFQGAAGAIEGEVTALKSGGQGVVADAWSSQGELGELLDEVRQMILTIKVKG